MLRTAPNFSNIRNRVSAHISRHQTFDIIAGFVVYTFNFKERSAVHSKIFCVVKNKHSFYSMIYFYQKQKEHANHLRQKYFIYYHVAYVLSKRTVQYKLSTALTKFRVT